MHSKHTRAGYWAARLYCVLLTLDSADASWAACSNSMLKRQDVLTDCELLFLFFFFFPSGLCSIASSHRKHALVRTSSHKAPPLACNNERRPPVKQSIRSRPSNHPDNSFAQARRKPRARGARDAKNAKHCFGSLKPLDRSKIALS